MARNEKREARTAVRAFESPDHRAGLGDLGGERMLELLEMRRVARRRCPRDTHEEHATVGVDVLVEVDDVAVEAPDQGR